MSTTTLLPPLTNLTYPTTPLHAALTRLTNAFYRLQIPYCIIGSVALTIHAQKSNVPCRFPTSPLPCIDILIQPVPGRASEDIIHLLCTHAAFTADFRHTKRLGQKVKVQVLGYMGNRLLNEKDVLYNIRIFDEWTNAERRMEFDLEGRGDERIAHVTQPSTQKVYLMNAAWLLRQKVRLYNEQGRYRERDDTHDIVSLIEILGVEKKRLKVDAGKEEERKELEMLIKGWEAGGVGGGRTVLEAGIECPEILGPWWERWWVKTGLKVLLVLASLLLWEEWSAEHFARAGKGVGRGDEFLNVVTLSGMCGIRWTAEHGIVATAGRAVADVPMEDTLVDVLSLLALGALEISYELCANGFGMFKVARVVFVSCLGGWGLVKWVWGLGGRGWGWGLSLFEAGEETKVETLAEMMDRLAPRSTLTGRALYEQMLAEAGLSMGD